MSLHAPLESHNLRPARITTQLIVLRFFFKVDYGSFDMGRPIVGVVIVRELQSAIDFVPFIPRFLVIHSGTLRWLRVCTISSNNFLVGQKLFLKVRFCLFYLSQSGHNLTIFPPRGTGMLSKGLVIWVGGCMRARRSNLSGMECRDFVQ